MKLINTLLMLGVSLTTLWAEAAGNPEDLARQWCANCHTADGNSTSPLFPRLAGQQQGYLVQQLQALKAHNRSDQSAHDYMWGIAETLDDATINGIATYFASQKPLPNTAAVDSSLLSRGQQLFEKGDEARGTPACAACHGPHGEGNEYGGPRLAGQHAMYLSKQLHVFETAQRPSAVAMQAIIKTLNEEDIKAVTAYLQSLH